MSTSSKQVTNQTNPERAVQTQGREALAYAKDPHVVIVGGGFGGVAAAKALRGSTVRVTLIDRTNHHLFQPLLYQVATSVLPPGDIASSIRGILRRQANVSVTLGEVTNVDKAERNVAVDLSDGSSKVIAYDYLILATGARHSYFGKDEYESMRLA
jgi:NADH dehydrogenase